MLLNFNGKVERNSILPTIARHLTIRNLVKVYNSSNLEMEDSCKAQKWGLNLVWVYFLQQFSRELFFTRNIVFSLLSPATRREYNKVSCAILLEPSIVWFTNLHLLVIWKHTFHSMDFKVLLEDPYNCSNRSNLSYSNAPLTSFYR